MKIKSYYSRSVEEAMAAARAELGPDAMLVNSRKAPIQARHLGEYEVVFATLPADTVAGTLLPAAGEGAAQPLSDRLSSEVAELKKELEGMRRVLTRTACAPQQWTGVPPDVTDAFAALSAADVAPDLAREIVQSASNRYAPARVGRAGIQPAATFQRALVEEISSRFTTDPFFGNKGNGPRIVALAGPTGSGKTTTLVKLAVQYGLAARRPVLLLSMDTYRVAAAEQLRAYAGILGVGFQVLETVGALAQSIEENRSKELIFIDTPGMGFGELEDATGLAQFLSTREDIDTHLVLPASMKAADLTRMVNAFEVLRPRHLLFTKLDETGSFGPILNEAARTRKPLSFFTNGQRIPEDLESAAHQRVLDLILTGQGGKARAA
jgi:flagellar biosynthesis protein FlhF